jgi:periplasmic divalent cation tolerance protein
MKTTRLHVIALVTAPDRKCARNLARAIVQSRLAACVNIVPKIESHYWWEGRVESGEELLLIIKTTRRLLKRLETCVVEHHPYDTPEFITLDLTGGAKPYLDWIDDSVTR